SRTTPYLCPFLSVVRRTPRSTLFPYTTLFRSAEDVEIDPVDRLDGPHLAAEHALVDREVLLQAADADQHLTGRDRRRGLGDGLKDRKSTRLNSSHVKISYAAFCLKKKKTQRYC